VSSKYDVIVIGGGPSGSTVATRLAQRGRRVLLLEKEHFPRFHIGESLLPCSMPLFEELGVMPALHEHGFLEKYAAEFVTADGSVTRRYAFADGLIPGAPSAFEVDRAEFDHVLLENAAKRGVEVREGMTVTRFDITHEGTEVTARDAAGAETRCSAQLLIDATGQTSFIAGKLGMREMDQGLKNFAVFSHFEGAQRHEGKREGDITVVLVPGGWWWVIPLAGGRTSVGQVGPASMLRGRKADESYFHEQIAATPYLAKRLAGAQRVAPVRAISDYSYVSKKLAGDRFVLVGDAHSERQTRSTPLSRPAAFHAASSSPTRSGSRSRSIRTRSSSKDSTGRSSSSCSWRRASSWTCALPSRRCWRASASIDPRSTRACWCSWAWPS
jgi:flavin-dependent dehydrogenase